MVGAAVLVFGPGGAGKSTTANALACRLGWHHLEEDAYWVNAGWGRGLRTEAQEAQIQSRVMSDVASSIRGGTCVVLDFILYKTPPNPLTAYREALDCSFIPHFSIALRPCSDAIVERMAGRGRPNDLADLELRRQQAVDQLQVLGLVDPRADLVIDSTNLSLGQVTDQCVEAITTVLAI